MAEEAPRRRRDVPKLHVGLLVRVGENCRSAVLKGKQGTVVSVGRQVEVQLVGLEDDPKGCVRFINPTDLVPVDEAGSTDATVPSVQSRGLSWKVRPIGSGAQETPPTDEQVFEAASAPAAGAVQLRSGRGDGSTKEKLPTLEPGARIRVSESCRTVALRGRGNGHRCRPAGGGARRWPRGRPKGRHAQARSLSDRHAGCHGASVRRTPPGGILERSL